MKVVFDDEALDDLQRISAEIAHDNPRAARDLVGRIFDKAERLATRPIGKPTELDSAIPRFESSRPSQHVSVRKTTDTSGCQPGGAGSPVASWRLSPDADLKRVIADEGSAKPTRVVGLRPKRRGS